MHKILFRAFLVLTNSVSWKAEGAIKVNSFEKGIIEADEWIKRNQKLNYVDIQNKIFLFGGSQIYELGLEYCDIIEMTKVNVDINSGSKFPKLNENEWKKRAHIT